MSNISIATLNEHSLQAIFNHVAAHLLEQGEPARQAAGGACAYRGAGGTSCAVGCLISDEEYNPVWEGQTVDSLRNCPEEYEAREFCELAETRAELLADLQKIHDREPPEYWIENLGRVADKLGLSKEVLDE